MTDKQKKEFIEKERKYWTARAIKRSNRYVEKAEAVADEIGKNYLRTAKSVSSDVSKVFGTFSDRFSLSEAEAGRLLKDADFNKPLDKILKAAIERETDPEKKNELMAQLEAPAYKYRIERLNSICEQAKEYSENLFNKTDKALTTSLKTAMEEAHRLTITDLADSKGIEPTFSLLPKRFIKETVNANWSGQNYSKAIWSNTADLARRVKGEVTTAFLSGESAAKTAKRIEERYQVANYQARRVVRTEMAFCTNQAELHSYKEAGIKQYQFLALHDNRTSEICEELSEKIFDLDKAVVGVNYPPMHPFCRSSTIPIIPIGELNNFKEITE